MTLLEISKRHNSNKLVHEFEVFYDKHFNDIRNDVKNILEIGIWHGGSLRMWSEYFPNANIYGFDIHLGMSRENLKGFDRVKAIHCDATSKMELSNVLKNIGEPEFDIILDDGSHRMSHQQLTMNYLFDRVKSGGSYCIEDVHTSLTETPKLMSEWGVDADRKNTTYTMLKNYLDTGKMKSMYMTDEESKRIGDNIESCELYNGKRGMGSITSIMKKR